jgi:hypothetical protein
MSSFLIPSWATKTFKTKTRTYRKGRGFPTTTTTTSGGKWCSETVTSRYCFFGGGSAQTSGMSFAHLPSGNGFYWEHGELVHLICYFLWFYALLPEAVPPCFANTQEPGLFILCHLFLCSCIMIGTPRRRTPSGFVLFQSPWEELGMASRAGLGLVGGPASVCVT